VPHTETARCPLPDENYVVPIGKGRIVRSASSEATSRGESLCIITYGMGVHWSLAAAGSFGERITIVDLRSLVPLDEELIYTTVKSHGRCLVVTEDTLSNSFAQTVAARIQEHCWEHLDAPVRTIGSVNMPAIPLNEALEREMVLSVDKVAAEIESLLAY
jgi:2-oxoisovalerate dehydrogenase E1 component